MGIQFQGSAGDLLANPLVTVILLVLGTALIAVFIFLIVRTVLRRRPKGEQFDMVTLLITVPKEQQRTEGEQPQSLVEQLQIAEGMYANLGGLRAQRGMHAGLRGRTDHFALELVAHEGVISFYTTVPRYLKDFMEQQIHAQYPQSDIETVEDFNIFRPESHVAAASLGLKKKYIFPIQTYVKLETDSMNALTNALSKLQPDEGAVIQFVLRSAKGEWHNGPARVARAMQQGKPLAQAMRETGKGGFVASAGKILMPSKKSQEQEMLEQQRQASYRLSPMEEEIVKRLEEKTSKAGFDVNIRIVIAAQSEERARRVLNNVTDSFGQFAGYEYGNGFKVGATGAKRIVPQYIYRQFDEGSSFVLNTEEMTSVFHLPLPTSETPNIRWLTARNAPPPVNMPSDGLQLGVSDYRGNHVPVHIKREDRRRHVYVVGKSGVGKSVLLQNMAVQDIRNGEGVCVVDPHGDLVDGILQHIPKARAEDVVYFDPSDTERPVGLNMLEFQSDEQKDFAVQEMIAIFYKLFPPEMIGPMFEHNMRNVMLTLMEDREHPGTIADIPRMFTDKEFQKYKLQKVKDPIVRQFWEKEMAQTSDFHKSEMLGYLISKVGRFVENEMMRNIIGQPRSGFDVRDVMDKQKILLVNLSKGKTGEVNSSLLGLIIVSKLQMAAQSRADQPEEQRKDFYLYIDEFQNFVTDSIATILSEARKYRLNLTIAHQYIAQLVQNNDTKIRDAVFGNAGTMISFRVGVDDAETIAQEFEPVFSEYDVINVEQYMAYIKLLIDNTASKAFTIKTLPPEKGNRDLGLQMKELSRLKHGRDRSVVESEILERTKLGVSAPPAPAPPPAAAR